MIKCLGIGPGNLDYITTGGARLIAEADVIAGFEAVLKIIASLIKPETEVITLTYSNQDALLKKVADYHHTGKNCLMAFMGDLHFSGFQLLNRVERACGHAVETIPGISSAQILAARARVCFDDTTFVTFHIRGDISDYKQHLGRVLADQRNAIVIPRPWDFMPTDIASFLIEAGASGEHPVEVYENLTAGEQVWRGVLEDSMPKFTDMCIMLIRKLQRSGKDPGSTLLPGTTTAKESKCLPASMSQQESLGKSRADRAHLDNNPQQLKNGNTAVVDENGNNQHNNDPYHIILAGHGSRDKDGIAEFESFVRMMKDRYPKQLIGHGYLEFEQPTIVEAVRKVVKAIHIEKFPSSSKLNIVVVPALLSAATHAKNDMPSELHMLRREFPQANIQFASAMDLHPLLLRLCQMRIVAAEEQSRERVTLERVPRERVKRSDTCLVIVGRGTSDPDANADIAKLARMLEEGMGFGCSFVCYSGTAKPLVADGLKTGARLGYKRMIVLPYFLFDGTLVKRIYQAADNLQKRYPELELLKAQYLGIHPYIADVFMERAQQGIDGLAHMNCSLCKYRTPIVGYEEQVGLPQAEHMALNDIIANQIPPVVSNPAAIKPGQNRLLQRQRYKEHPIERESFQIIKAGTDWSSYSEDEKVVLQRLVHTTGDFGVIDDFFISPGAIDIGVRAILRCRHIVTDVTMVTSGLNRNLLAELNVTTWCGVHDAETYLMANSSGRTRSACGIERAWQKWSNDVVLAIGDAPTALQEALTLIRQSGFRPQLLIGLPVGFVGTLEAKSELKNCLQVPRITNSGTRGGSNWAAAVVNALLILAKNRIANGANNRAPDDPAQGASPNKLQESSRDVLIV